MLRTPAFERREAYGAGCSPAQLLEVVSASIPHVHAALLPRFSISAISRRFSIESAFSAQKTCKGQKAQSALRAARIAVDDKAERRPCKKTQAGAL